MRGQHTDDVEITEFIFHVKQLAYIDSLSLVME